MPVWTHGLWTVKPGREDEFVAAWRAMAREVTAELGTGRPTLLRDRERPNLFMSFGPWEDDAAVERFRASAAFRHAREGMGDLLDGFEPRTLDEVGLDG
jgi:quinol monooxygenase YgiN